MSGFLLDTNVLSELRKESGCDSGVRSWIENAHTDELFVSVVSLGEIRRGIERIRTSDRDHARALEKWLQDLTTEFADRILLVDDEPALLEVVEDMAIRSVSCTVLRAANIVEARCLSMPPMVRVPGTPD